jgi:hypothetical protein
VKITTYISKNNNNGRYGPQLLKILPDDYREMLKFTFNAPAYYKQSEGKEGGFGDDEE